MLQHRKDSLRKDTMKKDRFITSIFNYCDYWCDRCPFTQRCRNYSMGQAMEAKLKQPNADTTNQAFWENLADQLSDASVFGTLSRDAGENSDAFHLENELDTLAEQEERAAFMEKEAARRKAVDNHLLMRLAMDYMKQTKEWLKNSEGELKKLAAAWLAAAPADDTCDYEELARKIGDMIEVITWYHTLLYPKLGRALRSILDKEDDFQEVDRYDANGTGKLVLIAAERSIAAWLFLREHLPQLEESILENLITLGRIRDGVNTVLPDAKAFKRPGFDTEPSLLSGR